MDRVCSTYGEKKRCIGFCWWIPWERGHMEDLCVQGRKILKQMFKKYYDEGVDRIYLIQDDDRWQDSCERGDESSIFIKGVKFLNKLRNY
jgi:hypothetical protein